MRAYGGEAPACACCGEQGAAFLTLDHVNNGGNAHRRQKGNQGVYHELRRAGYPAGFQVLCFNCNVARRFYGHCPHQTGNSARSETATLEQTPRLGIGARHCTRCRQDLPFAAFYPDKGTRSGLQSRCRVCTREASIARLNTAREMALAHYSAGAMQCACCGEAEVKFLALDHIGGEGPRIPGNGRVGNAFFAWLKREGFPAGLQVLCHNCNGAKGKDRPCPHEEVVASSTLALGTSASCM
jgi:hypothetical protein